MRFPLMENTGLLFKLTWPKLFYVGQAVNNWVFLVLITPRIELCLGVGQQYIFFIFWRKKTSKANQIWTWRILRSLVYVRSIISGQTLWSNSLLSSNHIQSIKMFHKCHNFISKTNTVCYGSLTAKWRTWNWDLQCSQKSQHSLGLFISNTFCLASTLYWTISALVCMFWVISSPLCSACHDLMKISSWHKSPDLFQQHEFGIYWQVVRREDNTGQSSVFVQFLTTRYIQHREWQ